MLSKKGYTLLDVLISLFVIFLIASWFFTSLSFSNQTHVYAVDYLKNQSEAMDLKQKVIYDDIKFYPNGNVDKSITIIRNNYEYIIHLGTGRLRYVN